uniref:Uncharacterized protein n=1 Tax=Sinocyclocheilus rhinocerous TaxID=307959 RepID=A0A673ITP6_9TELE
LSVGMISDLPKVLILGAIAAASAFVVTILIVLVCVGLIHTTPAALRQSKLNSMSKSDTRLHDMHRLHLLKSFKLIFFPH